MNLAKIMILQKKVGMMTKKYISGDRKKKHSGFS